MRGLRGLAARARIGSDLDEIELSQPDWITIFKIISRAVLTFVHERPAQIIGSAVVLIMLWGYHGNLDLLQRIWPSYRGPGVDIGTRPTLIPGVPWDDELISFCGGAFLLVVVPIGLIKFGFKERLADYGLGLPPKGRRALAVVAFLCLTLILVPAFWFGSRSASMRAIYPFYRPFQSVGQFALYELSYLPFFIAIEFMFRGYLLFGLARATDAEVRHSAVEAFQVHKYVLLIQMLSYTAWHLGKPLPELWSTLAWGIAAGAAAYAVRSIWPLVLAHWLLNVFLDAAIVWSP